MQKIEGSTEERQDVYGDGREARETLLLPTMQGCIYGSTWSLPDMGAVAVQVLRSNRKLSKQ